MFRVEVCSSIPKFWIYSGWIQRRGFQWEHVVCGLKAMIQLAFAWLPGMKPMTSGVASTRWRGLGFFKTARLGGEDTLTLFWKQTSPVDRKKRGNPMVESFNSKLRTVQYIKKHVSQECFLIYWRWNTTSNHSPMATERDTLPLSCWGLTWEQTTGWI